MIDPALQSYMSELLRMVPQTLVRYLYYDINWDARLVGIVGARGVGKSTLILQRIKQLGEEAKALYVLADSLYFDSHSLVGLADDLVKMGGTHLFIDEVHKYKGWSRELKQIYDVHPSLHVVFTGSSVLDILGGEADLSRRALVYHLKGLSFREYLLLFKGIRAAKFTLDDIINHKVSLPAEVEHPLPLFMDYLQRGYYPFAIEGDFAIRLMQTIALSIEVDIAQHADLKASTARKIKQLLGIIAQLAPFKPNANNLAKEIGVSKNNIPDYLDILERADLITMLRDDTAGLRALGKVEKVYLQNPNMMSILSGGQPNIGNVRETFFLSQMQVRHSVVASRQSDFLIGDITFEVGGKGKGTRQIADLDNAFVVKDDIEYGGGNILPLWHFGLTY